jgi:hypothetical protein
MKREGRGTLIGLPDLTIVLKDAERAEAAIVEVGRMPGIKKAGYGWLFKPSENADDPEEVAELELWRRTIHADLYKSASLSGMAARIEKLPGVVSVEKRDRKNHTDKLNFD